MGALGLGLALKPKDFRSKLSCRLSSVARTRLSRAQARAALKLGSSHIASVLLQTKSSLGWGSRGQGGC